MESNGKPGQIHVSASTAECLIASGKGRWLTPREDKIVAKGVGEMTTCWVNVQCESVGTVLSTSTHSLSKSQDANEDNAASDDEDEFAEDVMEPSKDQSSPMARTNSTSQEASDEEDSDLDDDKFAQAVRRRTREQAPPFAEIQDEIAENLRLSCGAEKV